MRNVFQDLRKGLSPTFTSGKIKGMLELLEGGIDQMIDHLEEVTDKDTLVEVKVQRVICKKMETYKQKQVREAVKKETGILLSG